jgi:hypothetical protein
MKSCKHESRTSFAGFQLGQPVAQRHEVSPGEVMVRSNKHGDVFTAGPRNQAIPHCRPGLFSTSFGSAGRS